MDSRTLCVVLFDAAGRSTAPQNQKVQSSTQSTNYLWSLSAVHFQQEQRLNISKMIQTARYVRTFHRLRSLRRCHNDNMNHGDLDLKPNGTPRER